MAVPVIKFPTLMVLVRLIGVIVSALVLTWTVHYRGGLALVSDNKDLIFNVRIPTLSNFHFENDQNL
jgi:cytochrome b-561